MTGHWTAVTERQDLDVLLTCRLQPEARPRCLSSETVSASGKHWRRASVHAHSLV